MKTATRKPAPGPGSGGGVLCGVAWLAGYRDGRRCRAVTRRARQLAVCAVTASAVTVPMAVAGAAEADTAAASAAHAPAAGWTRLRLQNGWTSRPFGTSPAAVRTISGIVHLKGAIATTGSNPGPFTLPAAFRPASTVFVPVDLCGAKNGRLEIEPSGVVSVDAGSAPFANAACFTSLDGVSFAKSALSFTRLTLRHGWTASRGGTSPAAARVISGIVYLKGAIKTHGTNPVPFTLPRGFRPARAVFVKVDLCNTTNGRLQIKPDGTATVAAENGAFGNAACFTSLDGAWFATSATSFTPLTPANGWSGAPFGTSAPAARAISGIIYLKGAIQTSGTSPVPFTLPARFRPATVVYVPADLCTAANGRLQIKPDGTVTVQAENGTFRNAACFTSLDGISYAP